MGKIRFDDLPWEKGYNPNTSYGQSKLANLLFALELQRRSDAAGWNVTSIAAHPGVSSTDLIANGPGSAGNGIGASAARFVTGVFGHAPAAGALPQIFAATSPEAVPGAYYGPQGLLEFAGPPGPAHMTNRARDANDAARLWTISEQLTGVVLPSLAKAA
jgi:NAD(P)-dependent dehydrogenase (short-subunit alcohol dehydrogenase family)